MIVNDGGSNFDGYFTFLYINLLQNLTSLTNYLFRQGNSEAGPLFVWGLEEDCTIRHGIDFSVIFHAGDYVSQVGSPHSRDHDAAKMDVGFYWLRKP